MLDIAANGLIQQLASTPIQFGSFF